ncbi:MAG: TIGR03663 family protein [Anaerolineales bacterium]|nr:TIGR03663 family protein [Anaerolineales bacterium]
MSSAQAHDAWLDKPALSLNKITWETLVFSLIVLLAVVSRFYDLGARVMSHDETSHVYFSWLLEQGRGYKHDPITHGPLQFHLVALSYFFFGDNDFTARIPAALFSIATVAFAWNYRRYLGKSGALIAALLLLISPFMLYYGRYVRNEAFVGLFGVVTLWSILRYLDSGEKRYLYWLTIATVLHFTAKETAFIYTAQALIFLAVLLLRKVISKPWVIPGYKGNFLTALVAAALGLAAAAALYLAGGKADVAGATEAVTPTTVIDNLPPAQMGVMQVLPAAFAAIGLLALAVGVYFLIRGYTWKGLCAERSFDMLVVLGTMVLPMLAPFLVSLVGLDPIEYTNNTSVLADSIAIGVLALLAIFIGVMWNPRLWLANAAIFYGVFTVLYTTVFTNGFGFVTGLVGSLGYWAKQQEVNRGSQPWYYYLLIQVPVYEYLPALGSLFAVAWAWLRRKPTSLTQEAGSVITEAPIDSEEGTGEKLVVPLLAYWSVTSLLAYTVAGEKMPWLTYHIALPMILLCAWGLGKLVEAVAWDEFVYRRGWLVVLFLPVFLTGLLMALGSLLGASPPFQGKTLEQLQATSVFLVAALAALLSGVGILTLVRDWKPAQFNYVLSLTVFVFSGLLTARAAIMASYLRYDEATEFLVYAHSARGPKEALAQIEEISRRTTDGLAIRVAYDNETTYPYWWYLRNYTNHLYYDKNPTRELRDAPVILVGDNNYGKIEPVVGQAYYQFDYVRLWWPNQDYFGLTLERIANALKDANMRAALFQIWLNRDYTAYGEVTGKDIGLPNWYPSARMRLYIRKDMAAKIWNYGAPAAEEAVLADPYEGKELLVSVDKIIGSPGSEPGQFQAPHDLAIAADGSLFVVDTQNHRIQHLDAAGQVIDVWGSFSDNNLAPAPGGTFNQPWGIALGEDGAVYVADTWNHRIQKFTAQGEFLTMWGYFGQAETPDALWGPRDIAVDGQNRVYVTDTGNKRVVVYTSEGEYIAQFGEVGLAPGQFDEPVGIAFGTEGQIFIADTWNQRVQSILPSADGTYLPLTSWDIAGWYGTSLDNKPYLAVDSAGNVYVTDPEGYRILEFDSQGNFIQYWGDYSTEVDGFGLPASIAIDSQDGAWVADAGNHRLMHFTLTQPASP